MFHLIILLLKIILISLLVLIGLILLGIFALLFVPFRYKVNAEHGDEVFELDARVTWLLHMIRARIINMEGKFHIKVKFLCFTLYDSLKPRKKKEKKQRKTNISKNADNKNGHKKKAISKNEAKVKQRNASGNRNTEIATKTKPNTSEKTEATKKLETTVKNVINLGPETIGQPEALVKKEAVKAEIKVKPEQTPKPSQQISENKYVNPQSETEKQEQGKDNIFRKIWSRIKGFITKIRTFFSGLRSRLAKFFDTAVNLKKKVSLISEFVKDKLNREGFEITYRSLKRILRHIKPTKLRSRLVFGTGDPCSTGQALGVMGILYSFYGDKVRIIPDFENKIFEGKHYARGRIRLFTIIIIVIKLILDKRFKRLRGNFQILKEAL